MKKIAASLGLVALGAMSVQSVHAAYTPGLDEMQTSKTWSIESTLRGFYDDNYNLAASGSPDKRSSFGFELNPSLSFNFPFEQTLVGGSYDFSMKYYDDRPNDNADYQHQVDLWLNHAFSHRCTLDLRDSLVIAQEPTVLDPNNLSEVTRTEGNNIRNTATAVFRAELTRQYSTEVGYRNTLYDYQESGGNYSDPSYAGLLNRMEHNVWVELHSQLQPTTVGLIGYQFNLVDYTKNESIAQSPDGLITFYSRDRDNVSHIGYVGVEHNFLPNFSASAKAGVQYTDYYNDPTGQTELNPYFVLSTLYTYTRGSYIQAGFSYARNQTDVATVGSNNTLTQDQESAVVYASINHAITAKLIGSASGHFQYSTFNGGTVDGDRDLYYSVDLNLAYHINQHLSSEVGYSFDDLQSDGAHTPYNRDRVYIGVTAAY